MSCEALAFLILMGPEAYRLLEAVRDVDGMVERREVVVFFFSICRP